MTENKFAYTKVCLYVHEYIIIDDIIMVLRESLTFNLIKNKPKQLSRRIYDNNIEYLISYLMSPKMRYAAAAACVKEFLLIFICWT